MMLARSARWAIGSLVLCAAGPAAAQADLDQGKTAAQLYASDCANCHKSPQSVTSTKWLFGLESFLTQHYTSGRQSAAILAAYLKEQDRQSGSAQRARTAARVSQARPVEPPSRNAEEDIPRPPADIPDVRP
jgi:mono/diheme cytochrome c family protein